MDIQKCEYANSREPTLLACGTAGVISTLYSLLRLIDVFDLKYSKGFSSLLVQTWNTLCRLHSCAVCSEYSMFANEKHFFLWHSNASQTCMFYWLVPCPKSMVINSEKQLLLFWPPTGRRLTIIGGMSGTDREIIVKCDQHWTVDQGDHGI